ncbi:hypothetical protein ABBQ38_010617 [Trebouxia sp. C0009 RCD-2024]
MIGLKVESGTSQSSKPSSSAAVSTAAAGRASKPVRAAAKKASSIVHVIDSDDDEEILSGKNVNSPAPAAKPVARPRNPAASRAKAKPPAAPTAGDGSKAVAKRKLQQPKLPFKPQQEQPEDQAEISGSNEPEAASPMVIPKGKVRRMRPSPFNKASGASKSRLAPDLPAPSKVSHSSPADSEDDEDEVAPRARAAPRRTAVAAKKNYVEIDDDASDIISIEDSDGSEFEA